MKYDSCWGFEVSYVSGFLEWSCVPFERRNNRLPDDFVLLFLRILIDNPDDPAVRTRKAQERAHRAWKWNVIIHLAGLTENPRNVVFASNRGQNGGGRVTLPCSWWDNLSVNNLTMGNYCNGFGLSAISVLNRKMRMLAITGSVGLFVRATESKLIMFILSASGILSAWEESVYSFHGCHFDRLMTPFVPRGSLSEPDFDFMVRNLLCHSRNRLRVSPGFSCVFCRLPVSGKSGEPGCTGRPLPSCR